MTLFGAVLRRAVVQRSSFAVASQIRALRAPRPIVVIDDRQEGDAGQWNVPTPAAGRSMGEHIAQERFKGISTESRLEQQEPLPKRNSTKDETSEHPLSTGFLEYTAEEKEKFAAIPEIAKDDEFRSFKLSAFDPGFLDSADQDAKPVYIIEELVKEVEVLQKLVQLGVSIHKWQEKQDVIAKVISLNWNQDCAPRIQLLYNRVGLAPEEVQKLLAKNPLFLCEEFHDLRERIEYLYAERADTLDNGGWGMTRKNVIRIIRNDALWLSFPIVRIQNRVRFLTNTFQLTGKEIVGIAIRHPRAITYSLRNLVLLKSLVIEEMGFSFDDFKKIFIGAPKLLTQNRLHLRARFDLLFHQMGFVEKDLVDVPKVLTIRDYRLRERLEFLLHLNRAQFDRQEPDYISASDMAKTPDEQFVTMVAKSTMQEYKDFVKSYASNANQN